MDYNLKIGLASIVLVLGFSQANADTEALKVCTAEDEMPYSNQKGEGFENALALLLGKALNRPVEWVFWSDPRYYIRDFLEKDLCDVVMGVDAGDPRVLTSVPYYRSGYVFISKQKDHLDVQDWASAALQKVQKIAFVPGTPAETMLRSIGRYNDLFNYSQQLVGYKSKRNQYVKYDNAKLVGEVAQGNAGLAVLWGPAAGRYVKASDTPLVMTLINDNNVRSDGEKVGFHYSTSMGVNKNNKALLQQVNKFITEQQNNIDQVLQAEGMPLIPESAAALVLNKK
ncbi:MAG: methanol oxidation system protein MoxJ [Methylococcaceae bacterium]|jgi:mxaJ protein